MRLDARSLRDEKAKVFAATEPFDPADAVYGQFEGYRDEEDVDADSDVETLVALRVHVDTWRWAGVPFVLRTGKAMKAGAQTITVGFREPPLRMFDPSDEVVDHPNEVCFDLTSDGAITVDLRAKVPGPQLELGLSSLGIEHAPGATATSSRPTSASCSTSCTATTRCSRAPTRSSACGSSPSRCSTTRRRRSPTTQGSWGPQAALELAGPAGWRVSRAG